MLFALRCFLFQRAYTLGGITAGFINILVDTLSGFPLVFDSSTKVSRQLYVMKILKTVSSELNGFPKAKFKEKYELGETNICFLLSSKYFLY